MKWAMDGEVGPGSVPGPLVPPGGPAFEPWLLVPDAVARLRAVLAGGTLPGVADAHADSGGDPVAGPVPRETTATWVDLLGELAKIKHAVTAAQARLAVALDDATTAAEKGHGIREARRGRGVPSQVGAAMGLSPHAGASFLGDARVWLRQMPRTFEALRLGALSEWRARILVRETSHLTPEHQAVVDEQVCGDPRLLAGLGGKRLTARTKELAAGVGTVPGPVARELVAAGVDAGAAWLRTIYTDPAGRLLATTSTSRFFPEGIVALLRARQQGVCATSYCDAPVRHADHVVRMRTAGPRPWPTGRGCAHGATTPSRRRAGRSPYGRRMTRRTVGTPWRP